jgi:hypothetical protein
MYHPIKILNYFSSLFPSKASVQPPAPPSTPIDLTGTLRRGRAYKPVMDASLYVARVELDFNINLGSLDVEVIDEHGDTTFKTTVNAVSGDTLSIGTSGWASGEYTIVIMDAQRDYLDGDFMIE